jgi:hypothetical protein
VRHFLLRTLIRAALIGGALVAVLAGPADAGRLVDGARAGRLDLAMPHAETVLSRARGDVVPAQSQQGGSNSGAATPGPTPAPGPAPMPGPPTHTPAFGTPNVVFVVGIWRIIRSQGEFYLWTDNGDTAIQITLDSNGWWGLRRRADERIIWSSGKSRNDPFYDRPWLRAPGATYPISDATYQDRSQWGVTYLDIANDWIRITLTDRGEIQLDARTPAIVFRTSRGEIVNF